MVNCADVYGYKRESRENEDGSLSVQIKGGKAAFFLSLFSGTARSDTGTFRQRGRMEGDPLVRLAIKVRDREEALAQGHNWQG